MMVNNLLPVTLPWLLVVLVVQSSHVRDEKVALIIVDIQNCFLDGGTLAVHKGDEVIPVIKQLRSQYRDRFSLVVMTQDWHCPDHVSFASQHPGHDIYSQINLEYDKDGNLCKGANTTLAYSRECDSVAHHVQQTMWPDHCVINTTDASFSGVLTTEYTDLVIRKGYHCQVDSYSAFYDNGGFGQTELHGKLQAANITSVYITGLARDYCVLYTAKDALKLGYQTYVVLDATRGVAEDTSIAAVQEMKNQSIYLIDSGDVGYTLPPVPSQEERTALLIIDVQNCFLAGGSLAVTNGEQVIPVINNIRSKLGHRLDLIVLSQDWHCADHVSFASQHVNGHVYDNIFLSYDSEGNLCDVDNVTSPYAGPCVSVSHRLSQTLWPDHCIINTTSAKISSELTRDHSDIVVRKGYRCQIDSYSVFYDNGGFTQTEMQQTLQEHNISTVYVVGMATDFCVYRTSLDAKRLGYNTYIVEDAIRGLTQKRSTDAINDMMSKGIHVINSTDMYETLPDRSQVVTPTGPVSDSRTIHWHLTALMIGCISSIFVTYN